jgi:hypothetical protein
MSSKQAVYTKAGNRQKPTYQDLVDMVSESLKNIDNRKNIIKTSFTTTGILNSRIGQFNQRRILLLMRTTGRLKYIFIIK